MAGKIRIKLASYSPRTIILAIPNFFPVPCEIEIAIVVFLFVIRSNYKRFRYTDNITWNAKMIAEHVGTIAKRAWYTDWASRTWVPGLASLSFILASLSQLRYLSLFQAKLLLEL